MPVIDMNDYRRASDGPAFLDRLAGYRPEIIAEARSMRGHAIFMRTRARDMRATGQHAMAASWESNAIELESCLERMLTHHQPVPAIPPAPQPLAIPVAPIAMIEVPLSPVRVISPVDTTNALRRLRALAEMFRPRRVTGRPA